MPIPVPISGTPLPATDANIARAEQLLAAIVQVVARGSNGSSLNTLPTYVPDPNNQGAVIPLELASPQTQLTWRQLSVALAIWENTSPPPPGPPPTYSFTATCLSTAQIGDLVYMTGGAGNEVRGIDISDYTKMPAVGCIVSKESPTDCTVQTSNILVGAYSGLTPGKIYFSGSGSNPKPVHPAPIPGSGQSLFHQPIGIAINSTTMALMPSSNLTRVRG
jgi:hypothetical protein